MEQGEHLVLSSVLAALYLRGAPFKRPLQRKRWPLVRDAIRATAPSLGHAAEALSDSGLWDESAILRDPSALDWALEHIESESVLTAESFRYPARWIEVLGTAAPPALWRHGIPATGNSVSIVGCRHLTAHEARFARKLGALVIGSGKSLVTGGAVGSDQESAVGALETGAEGRITIIAPQGLDPFLGTPVDPRYCTLSVCEPHAAFTAGQAMERNALIYASSNLSFVVKSNYKAGGTWHGATDALRRRLTKLAVRHYPGDIAGQTLCQLGGVSFRTLEDAHRLMCSDFDRVYETPQAKFAV